MRNEIIVQKMAGYAAKVIDYCKGYTYESFAADTKLVEACVFNLSQHGELCRVADDSLKSRGGRCTACATALSMTMRAST